MWLDRLRLSALHGSAARREGLLVISYLALALAVLNTAIIVWGEIERHRARKEQPWTDDD